MKLKFEVEYNVHGYYITGVSSADEYIATLCNISENEYKNIMVDEYNAIPISLNNPYIYFKKSEQAEKSIEWVESMIVMNKLLFGG
jgi:hypothetical protein